LPGKGYHVFIDNLFTSTKFLELLRSRGYGATRTCQTNAGILTELIEIKKSDKNDIILWGETYSLPTESNMVCQTRWKDNAFALIESTVMDGEHQTLRNRKRPKETSSKAKTARKPFGDQPRKDLWIPAVFDKYNYNMNAVDRFDSLTANNSGLRPVRRGGWQAIEHWLLRVALVNSFLVSFLSDVPGKGNISFRSQQDFRIQLVQSLLDKGKNMPLVPKRRVSKISTLATATDVSEHQLVTMPTRKRCVTCAGLRAWDRPQKRVALGEIAANEHRESTRKASKYGCKQCDVTLCQKGGCFETFHRK
jgi:hypothetical protein